MRLKHLLSTALIASLLPVAALAAGPAPSAAAASPDGAGAFCSGEARVTKKLAAGTSWDLCWRIDATSGLTLEKIFFQGVNDAAPIQTFNSLAPVLMNVPYDSGTAEYEDMGSVGWNAITTDAMGVDECPDPKAEILTVDAHGTNEAGELVDIKDKPIVCVNEVDTGLAGRSSFTTYTTDAEGNRQGGYFDFDHRVTLQGTALVLFSHVTIGNYEYESRYTLHDNGTIELGLGATGEISVHQWVDQMDGLDPRTYGWPVGTGASDFTPSHYHSGVWRVDFGIDGNDDQVIEQFDSAPNGERGAVSPLIETTYETIGTESFRNVAPRRGWWVHSPSSLNADGHARGYEIIFGKTEAYPSNAALRNDLAFTQKKDCELRPQDNAALGCEGTTLIDFVNDETITDPVAFVNVGFHHIARDEDQSPMPVHWQGFMLYPRDFTAQSPWTPESRAYRNGFVPTDELELPGWQTPAASATVLQLSSAAILPGEAVDATVSITAGDKPVTGTVQLRDGGTTIATHDLRKGESSGFTVRLEGLAEGSHTLTAYYEGDVNAGSSTSEARTIVVSTDAPPTGSPTPVPGTSTSAPPVPGASTSAPPAAPSESASATPAPAAVGGSRPLASTGGDTGWIVPVAVTGSLVMGAGILLLLARRRRSQHTATE